MRSEDIEDKATTRAVPLPEERAVEHGGEDRKAQASRILRDSEDRLEEAASRQAPADAATEHRRSEDTAGP